MTLLMKRPKPPWRFHETLSSKRRVSAPGRGSRNRGLVRRYKLLAREGRQKSDSVMAAHVSSDVLGFLEVV